VGDQGQSHRGKAKAAAAGRGESPNPQPPIRDPGELADMIIVALVPVQVYGLTATADRRGVVTLSGAVRTEREFERAHALAARVPGVTRVINQLVIDTLTGSTPIDRTIVDPELAAEIELNHLHFAQGTEVSLNRHVGTTDTAESTAENVPFFAPTDPPTKRAPRGAEGFEVTGGFSETSLDAPIELEQLPTQLLDSDGELARLVRMALQEDAETADLPIAVNVRRGIVHLRGSVESLADVEIAEAVAVRVPGVIEVKEDLEVAGL